MWFIFIMLLSSASYIFSLHFGVTNWLSAHKVGEVFWQNPFAMTDLESPLKEGALTLLNSYFQKHKTYQNTCEDQLSHSILSNLLLPNCNLFLETWAQMGETFQAKWEEEYLCLQFAMMPLFTLWSLVHGTHVLQNTVKSYRSLAFKSSKQEFTGTLVPSVHMFRGCLCSIRKIQCIPYQHQKGSRKVILNCST